MDGLFLTGPLPGGPTRHLPKPDLAQHLRYTLDGIHRKPQALVTRTGLCLCCDKLTELYGGSCLDCWDRSDDD